jgi:hypothetical protein
MAPHALGSTGRARCFWRTVVGKTRRINDEANPAMGKNLLSLTFIALLSGLPVTAAEHVKVRNLSGKWVLNLEKSESPKAEVTTMVIEHDGNIISWTATVDGSDGNRVKQFYEGAFDGEPHPVLQDGIKRAAIAYTAIDPSTIKSVSTLPDGKKATATHTISEDGKTITTRGESGSLSVWHKQ